MLPPVPGRYAVIAPGATKAWHVWPIDRFAEVGRALYDEFGMQTIVIGSPKTPPFVGH